jgi:hypothetical protein
MEPLLAAMNSVMTGSAASREGQTRRTQRRAAEYNKFMEFRIRI